MKASTALLFAFFLLLTNECLAQRQDLYNAPNGISYHEGDTVKIGRGSGLNGSFVYLTFGGWVQYTDPNLAQSGNVSSAISGFGVVIKKIRRTTLKGVSKVYFTVGAGNISNYYLDIDGAIASCEVVPCKNAAEATQPAKPDKLDQLKKLKELLDTGAITQEEFDTEKKKILNN